MNVMLILFAIFITNMSIYEISNAWEAVERYRGQRYYDPYQYAWIVRITRHYTAIFTMLIIAAWFVAIFWR